MAATRRPPSSATTVMPVSGRALSSAANTLSAAASEERPRRTTRFPSTAPSWLGVAYVREAGMGVLSRPAAPVSGQVPGVLAVASAPCPGAGSRRRPHRLAEHRTGVWSSVMWNVGLVGVLAAWVIAVGWRALRGAPPAHPIRFAIVAAVSATIHLGFHAAATAAPTLDAVALVLAGWTTFGLWCVWLGRLPSRGFRPNEDDGPSDGGRRRRARPRRRAAGRLPRRRRRLGRVRARVRGLCGPRRAPGARAAPTD